MDELNENVYLPLNEFGLIRFGTKRNYIYFSEWNGMEYAICICIVQNNITLDGGEHTFTLKLTFI